MSMSKPKIDVQKLVDQIASDLRQTSVFKPLLDGSLGIQPGYWSGPGNDIPLCLNFGKSRLLGLDDYLPAKDYDSISIPPKTPISLLTNPSQNRAKTEEALSDALAKVRFDVEPTDSRDIMDYLKELIDDDCPDSGATLGSVNIYFLVKAPVLARYESLTDIFALKEFYNPAALGRLYDYVKIGSSGSKRGYEFI